MTPEQVESIYEALAQAVDASDEAPEIVLAKLCLALAYRLGDPAAVHEEIGKIGLDSGR